MRYIEVIVNTPEEEIDLRCQQMADMGAGGFVIENEADFQAFLENNHQYWDYVDQELEDKFKGLSRIKCYLTDDAEGLAVLRAIQAAYSDVETSFLEDSDWENNWREYYKPIEVGEKLVVVPEWEEIPQDGRLPLRLDPGLIFGTGSHATTRMCLAALEQFAGAGVRVLDLGCGSGILGIGAAMLGAKEVLAVDIDPSAVKVARENIAQNHLEDRVRAVEGNLLEGIDGTCEVCVANIIADVICMFAAPLNAHIVPGGLFICSGIIKEREQEVLDALKAADYTVLEVRRKGEWVAILSRRHS